MSNSGQSEEPERLTLTCECGIETFDEPGEALVRGWSMRCPNCTEKPKREKPMSNGKNNGVRMTAAILITMLVTAAIMLGVWYSSRQTQPVTIPPPVQSDPYAAEERARILRQQEEIQRELVELRKQREAPPASTPSVTAVLSNFAEEVRAVRAEVTQVKSLFEDLNGDGKDRAIYPTPPEKFVPIQSDLEYQVAENCRRISQFENRCENLTYRDKRHDERLEKIEDLLREAVDKHNKLYDIFLDWVAFVKRKHPESFKTYR